MPNDKACKHIVLKEEETHMQELSKCIGKTLSSYTQGIDIEQKRTGNLFQKKTKAKLTPSESKYLLSCTSYIHTNPAIANLCIKEDEWEYSSAKDYYGLRNGTLCNKALLYKESGLSEFDFKTSNKMEITKRRLRIYFLVWPPGAA